MYSLRVEAQQRETTTVDLGSLHEFPQLVSATGRGSSTQHLDACHAEEGALAGEGPEEQLHITDSVEFTAGNPRVEHITGVVHLYREIPNSPGVAATSSSSPRPDLGLSSTGSPGATTQTPHARLPEQRQPVLCCLAIPADFSLADFCVWCGAYLSTIRTMRVLRREARQRVVCMVLIRFVDQQHADHFYADYNLKAFSSLEPEIMCRLVYVREMQILTPHTSDHAATGLLPPASLQLPVAIGGASTSGLQPGVDDQGSSLGHSPLRLLTGKISSRSGGRSPLVGGSRSPAVGTPKRISAGGFADMDAGGAVGTSVTSGTGRRLSAEQLGLGLLGGSGSGGGGLLQRVSAEQVALGLLGTSGGGGGVSSAGQQHLGTELPTCPVCLERLDEHISGVVTTVCNHQFHSDCLLKWGDTSCPVCRYCTQAHANASRCVSCNASQDLWICLICGHVGCGRYKAGHAYDHWKTHSHCYALELETQRVWDYVGDNYVHRLIQSKTDGKLVEVPTPGPPRHRRRRRVCHSVASMRGGMGGGLHRCSAAPAPSGESDECDALDEESDWSDTEENDEMKETLMASKLDHLADEYNHLLASQLDSQRSYYEGLLSQQATSFSHRMAAADAAAVAHQAALNSAGAAVKEAERKRQGVEKKLADLTVAHAKLSEERDFLKSLSDNLLTNQKELRVQADVAKAQVVEKDKQLVDMQEQVRDLMVFIEAGRMIGSAGAEDLKDATLLPAPAGAGTSKGRGGAGRSKGK